MHAWAELLSRALAAELEPCDRVWREVEARERQGLKSVPGCDHRSPVTEITEVNDVLDVASDLWSPRSAADCSVPREKGRRTMFSTGTRRSSAESLCWRPTEQFRGHHVQSSWAAHQSRLSGSPEPAERLSRVSWAAQQGQCQGQWTTLPQLPPSRDAPYLRSYSFSKEQQIHRDGILSYLSGSDATKVHISTLNGSESPFPCPAVPIIPGRVTNKWKRPKYFMTGKKPWGTPFDGGAGPQKRTGYELSAPRSALFAPAGLFQAASARMGSWIVVSPHLFSTTPTYFPTIACRIWGDI